MSDQPPMPEPIIAPPESWVHLWRNKLLVSVAGVSLVGFLGIEALAVWTDYAHPVAVPELAEPMPDIAATIATTTITPAIAAFDIAKSTVASCDNTTGPIATITEKWVGLDLEIDALQSSTTMQGETAVLDRAAKTIGVPIEVLMVNEVRGYPLDGYEPDDVGALKTNGLALLKGIREIPPQVVRAAHIPRFTLVEDIEGTADNEHINTLGFFIADPIIGGAIVLDANKEDDAIHEIMHALERSLCAFNPDWANKNLAAINREPYAGEDYPSTPRRKYTPGPDRVYASLYASKDAYEDSVESLRELFFTYGLIQPTDADFGSIFHEKQNYQVILLERLFPGITQDLKVKTYLIRTVRTKP